MTAPAVYVISFPRVSIWALIPPAGVVRATYAPWGRTPRRLALCRALLFLAVSVAFRSFSGGGFKQFARDVSRRITAKRIILKGC